MDCLESDAEEGETVIDWITRQDLKRFAVQQNEQKWVNLPERYCGYDNCDQFQKL